MKSRDVVKYVGPGAIPGRVSRAIGPLPLEHAEEALASRIVTTMSNGAHGADQRVLFEEPLVIATAELAAADALMLVKWC